MNLGDPELELIDPTPNVHSLFLHFDKTFFWAKLASRAVVRWSKRMYSCAGVCRWGLCRQIETFFSVDSTSMLLCHSCGHFILDVHFIRSEARTGYEGRGGLCDIALSEPLLKLRPRKDLVQTLLHEMIHAFLFITCRDRERDGHGPNFKAHMHRINKSAGLNITIYHDFHDEVELYLIHWWRCNGPCQTRKPYFGVVRKSQNRAPGPSDTWWTCHQRSCGGTFVKIKEPEKKAKKQAVAKNADITKYINNNNNNGIKDKNIKTINDLSNNRKPLTPVMKNPSNTPAVSVKSNGGKTVVLSPINQKGANINSTENKPQITPVFTGKGQTISGGRARSNSVSAVVETVRDVWLKKYGNTDSKGKELKRNNSMISTNNDLKVSKNKADNINSDSPVKKIRKIDDYFKNAATSVLKDLYGTNYKITQTSSDKKIVAVPVNDKKIESVPVKIELVDCPVCSSKIDSKDINKHLDECLNKEVIEKISKENSYEDVKPKMPSECPSNVAKTPTFVIPPFKPKLDKIIPKQEPKDILSCSNVSVDLTNVAFGNISNIKKEPTVSGEVNLTFDPADVNKVKSIVKKIQFDKHVRRSGFLIPDEVPVKTDVGFLPSFLADKATEIRLPPVKVEPGTSKGIINVQKCPCCGEEVKKPMAEHLDECLSFFDNNTTVPEEGASTSFANNTIVLDDDDEDDIFDETQTMNATGTKTPCPCCLKMVESEDMNNHLDICLS